MLNYSGSARSKRLTATAAFATFLFTFTLTGSALADPCLVNDPSGTVTLPPDGCPYLAGDEVFEIVNGLPLGSTIELAPIHKEFICSELALSPACTIPGIPGLSCEEPGGSLGGHQDCFESTLEFDVTGTGVLTGFTRTLSLGSSTVVVDTGPRTPGDPVQDFDTEMVALSTNLFGDPDFCVLRIRAGSFNGLPPSTGHTTLTALGSNNWNVDSFFDVVYEIEFQGCPGSILEGFGGTTQSQLRMQTGAPVPEAPLFTGSWLVLVVVLFGGLVFYATRRLQTA